LDFNFRNSPTPQVNAAQSSLWASAFALSQPVSDGWWFIAFLLPALAFLLAPFPVLIESGFVLSSLTGVL
jgi:hypothetical protein